MMTASDCEHILGMSFLHFFQQQPVLGFFFLRAPQQVLPEQHDELDLVPSYPVALFVSLHRALSHSQTLQNNWPVS